MLDGTEIVEIKLYRIFLRHQEKDSDKIETYNKQTIKNQKK